ncbi:hypothetical protein KAS31_00415, partial [Candidatus Parcubacteria bacterium]|nr:hypothetical protein [Candidatus Parcubacteria bacterium]
MNKKVVKSYLIIFFIFFVGFISVSFYNKTVFEKRHYNLDETLWEVRGYRFADELKNKNYSALVQSTHPGITV